MTRNICKAIIITALSEEADSICSRLYGLKDEIHPSGTPIYRRGSILSADILWDILVVETGMGNTKSAQATERAINYFNPTLAIFVGIAHGIKNASLGDVVVATETYYYEPGKFERDEKGTGKFKSRPEVLKLDTEMKDWAKVVARKWHHRYQTDTAPGKNPKVLFGPIASGEVVVNSPSWETYSLLEDSYNNVLALEMEGHGFFDAANKSKGVLSILIRGISDVKGVDKSATEKIGWREKAMRNARSFAFELISSYGNKQLMAKVSDNSMNQDSVKIQVIKKNAANSINKIMNILKNKAEPDQSMTVLFTDIVKYIRDNNLTNCEILKDLNISFKNLDDKTAPRIALVGQTGAGKSAMINAIFGQKDLAEVSIFPNTTDEINEYVYESGLIVYDTPGIFGGGVKKDKGKGKRFENTTRAFLNLSQLDQEKIDMVPIGLMIHEDNDWKQIGKISVNINNDEIAEVAPFDIALFTVDLSRTVTDSDQEKTENFIKILRDCLVAENKLSSIIVVGTHIDYIKPNDRSEILELWSEICSQSPIPISSSTEEGLSELVSAILQSLPGDTLIKFQESLKERRKIARRIFVITQVSDLLADVILHKGNEAKYIKEISIVLFALIYVHYSIDESEWQKSHGNILNIVESINKKGIKIIEKTREPKNIIERILKIIFRGDFKEKIEAYDILGIRGLEELVPIVYKLINIYENGSLSVLPDEKINDIISSYTSDMSLQIDAKNTMDLANTIGDLLKDLLDQSNQSKSREKK